MHVFVLGSSFLKLILSNRNPIMGLIINHDSAMPRVRFKRLEGSLPSKQMHIRNQNMYYIDKLNSLNSVQSHIVSISQLKIHQIFLLTRDWSKLSHVTRIFSPLKMGRI